MFVHGFPNLLMPNGPQSGSASTNYPRGIETGVDWCTDFLEHVREHGCACASKRPSKRRNGGPRT